LKKKREVLTVKKAKEEGDDVAEWMAKRVA